MNSPFDSPSPETATLSGFTSSSNHFCPSISDRTATATRAELRAELRQLLETSFIEQIDTFLERMSRLSRATDEEFTAARQLSQVASQRQRQIVWLSLLLSGGVGLVLTMLVSEILTRPLSEIAEIAEQSIQHEDFDLQAPIKTGDETGNLARAFNAYMTFTRNLLRDRATTNASLSEALEQLQSTQTQVIQSEKMSSLGQMVAGIAHEINNPVSFIHGNVAHLQEYTEGLLELLALYQELYPEPDLRIADKQDEIDLDFVTEDLPKTLASIGVGSSRIREIVLSLRNFSRIDEAELKPVDIHEGIENTLLILNHRLKPQPERAEIEVVRQYGSVPPVECFAGLLNQVLMNVISNAIDALEKDMQCSTSPQRPDPARIEIHTSVACDRQGGDWLRLSVSDNGPGVPVELQPRIFDPFFTTKDIGKGTGMGMSISYQIVTERHGGTLEYAASPEGGAEFIIHIPVCQKSRVVEIAVS